tara:strand:+ start:84 stop:653 length:570 start_codon:yes stop_codon:yes gene_type:complete
MSEYNFHFDKYDLRPSFFDGIDLEQFATNTKLDKVTIRRCLTGVSSPSSQGYLYREINRIKKITFPKFKKEFNRHKAQVSEIKKTHMSSNQIRERYKVGHIRLSKITQASNCVRFGSSLFFDVSSPEFLDFGLVERPTVEIVAEDPLRHIAKPEIKIVTKKNWSFPVDKANLAMTIINFILIVYGTFFK